jgi:hypothetical protein
MLALCDVARELEKEYLQKKLAGSYDAFRPRSTREELALLNHRLAAAIAAGLPELGTQYCPTKLQEIAIPPLSPDEEAQENGRQLERLLALADAASGQLESEETAANTSGAGSQSAGTSIIHGMCASMVCLCCAAGACR